MNNEETNPLDWWSRQGKPVPFKHQFDALKRSADAREFALFMEMGTGKSKVLLDTADHLWRINEIDAVLIVAPKGTYMNWFYSEIPTHLIAPNKSAYYSSSMRVAQRENTEKVMMLPSDQSFLKVICMNVEALSHRSGYEFASRFLSGHRALLCIDESTTIKTPKAQRTKSAIKLGKLAKYRRIMSGTPITQSPLDLFSQMGFLNWNILGFKSYYAFRNQFAEIQQVKLGSRFFPKITGYKNLNELQDKIRDHCYRVTKEECLDLPPKVYTRRYVELTDTQRRIYDQMRKEFVLQFESGSVTVTNALTMIVRLQQILCGHTKTDDGVIVDLPNARLDVLKEVIEETQGKVIIWCNFRHDIEQIHKLLSTMEVPHVLYYGDTGDEDRQFAIDSFQDSPLVKVFVGTTATGGMGITLTAAQTVIYYSNNYNLQMRLQSEDRAHRIGQTKTVTYIDLIVPNSIDDKILTALQNKKNLADQVLNSWREILE